MGQRIGNARYPGSSILDRTQFESDVPLYGHPFFHLGSSRFNACDSVGGPIVDDHGIDPAGHVPVVDVELVWPANCQEPQTTTNDPESTPMVTNVKTLMTM